MKKTVVDGVVKEHNFITIYVFSMCFAANNKKGKYGAGFVGYIRHKTVHMYNHDS